MVVWLNHLNKEKIREVSKLHKVLLSDSPIPKLGKDFMNGFYYSQLIKKELIHCLTFIEQNKVIGFIVITKYPGNFMLKGIQKSPFSLFIRLIEAILRNPKRLLLIFNMIFLALARKTSSLPSGTSELLSIGVLKEYRNNVDSKSGLRVSHALFTGAVEYLKKEKQKIFQVLTDKTNNEAIKFYKSMNMELTQSEFYDINHQVLFFMRLNNKII